MDVRRTRTVLVLFVTFVYIVTSVISQQSLSRSTAAHHNPISYTQSRPEPGFRAPDVTKYQYPSPRLFQRQPFFQPSRLRIPQHIQPVVATPSRVQLQLSPAELARLTQNLLIQTQTSLAPSVTAAAPVVPTTTAYQLPPGYPGAPGWFEGPCIPPPTTTTRPTPPRVTTAKITTPGGAGLMTATSNRVNLHLLAQIIGARSGVNPTSQFQNNAVGSPMSSILGHLPASGSQLSPFWQSHMSSQVQPQLASPNKPTFQIPGLQTQINPFTAMQRNPNPFFSGFQAEYEQPNSPSFQNLVEHEFPMSPVHTFSGSQNQIQTGMQSFQGLQQQFGTQHIPNPQRQFSVQSQSLAGVHANMPPRVSKPVHNNIVKFIAGNKPQIRPTEQHGTILGPREYSKSNPYDWFNRERPVAQINQHLFNPYGYKHSKKSSTATQPKPRVLSRQSPIALPGHIHPSIKRTSIPKLIHNPLPNPTQNIIVNSMQTLNNHSISHSLPHLSYNPNPLHTSVPVVNTYSTAQTRAELLATLHKLTRNLGANKSSLVLSKLAEGNINIQSLIDHLKVAGVSGTNTHAENPNLFAQLLAMVSNVKPQPYQSQHFLPSNINSHGLKMQKIQLNKNVVKSSVLGPLPKPPVTNPLLRSFMSNPWIKNEIPLPAPAYAPLGQHRVLGGATISRLNLHAMSQGDQRHVAPGAYTSISRNQQYSDGLNSKSLQQRGLLHQILHENIHVPNAKSSAPVVASNPYSNSPPSLADITNARVLYHKRVPSEHKLSRFSFHRLGPRGASLLQSKIHSSNTTAKKVNTATKRDMIKSISIDGQTSLYSNTQIGGGQYTNRQSKAHVASLDTLEYRKQKQSIQPQKKQKSQQHTYPIINSSVDIKNLNVPHQQHSKNVQNANRAHNIMQAKKVHNSHDLLRKHVMLKTSSPLVEYEKQKKNYTPMSQMVSAVIQNNIPTKVPAVSSQPTSVTVPHTTPITTEIHVTEAVEYEFNQNNQFNQAYDQYYYELQSRSTRAPITTAAVTTTTTTTTTTTVSTTVTPIPIVQTTSRSNIVAETVNSITNNVNVVKTNNLNPSINYINPIVNTNPSNNVVQQHLTNSNAVNYNINSMANSVNTDYYNYNDYIDHVASNTKNTNQGRHLFNKGINILKQRRHGGMREAPVNVFSHYYRVNTAQASAKLNAYRRKMDIPFSITTVPSVAYPPIVPGNQLGPGVNVAGFLKTRMHPRRIRQSIQLTGKVMPKQALHPVVRTHVQIPKNVNAAHIRGANVAFANQYNGANAYPADIRLATDTLYSVEPVANDNKYLNMGRTIGSKDNYIVKDNLSQKNYVRTDNVSPKHYFNANHVSSRNYVDTHNVHPNSNVVMDPILLRNNVSKNNILPGNNNRLIRVSRVKNVDTHNAYPKNYVWKNQVPSKNVAGTNNDPQGNNPGLNYVSTGNNVDKYNINLKSVYPANNIANNGNNVSPWNYQGTNKVSRRNYFDTYRIYVGDNRARKNIFPNTFVGTHNVSGNINVNTDAVSVGKLSRVDSERSRLQTLNQQLPVSVVTNSIRLAVNRVPIQVDANQHHTRYSNTIGRRPKRQISKVSDVSSDNVLSPELKYRHRPRDTITNSTVPDLKNVDALIDHSIGLLNNADIRVLCNMLDDIGAARPPRLVQAVANMHVISKRQVPQGLATRILPASVYPNSMIEPCICIPVYEVDNEFRRLLTHSCHDKNLVCACPVI